MKTALYALLVGILGQQVPPPQTLPPFISQEMVEVPAFVEQGLDDLLLYLRNDKLEHPSKGFTPSFFHDGIRAQYRITYAFPGSAPEESLEVQLLQDEVILTYKNTSFQEDDDFSRGEELWCKITISDDSYACVPAATLIKPLRDTVQQIHKEWRRSVDKAKQQRQLKTYPFY